MSAARFVSAAVLLLAACAGWESSSPSYSPPPVDGPAPSHYAPPPPGDPRAPVDAAPQTANAKVAIASVQLLQDCPDPAPEAPAAAITAPAGEAMQERSVQHSRMRRPAGESADGSSYRAACAQSTVQLSVRSDVAGQFRIEGVRVLAASTKKVAGPAKLRGPTRWSDADGTYSAWDERTVAGADLRISYKLGDPDLSGAADMTDDNFNTYMGPFILELDVSVDGRRQTIRSAEFTREPPHVMVT